MSASVAAVSVRVLQRGLRARAVGLVLLCAGLLLTASAWATDDYDVSSGEWNGLQELVRIAQTAEVELRAAQTLDWSGVRAMDGLLVLYPRTRLDLADLSGFLEAGGRLAVLDDFGDAEPLFRWFQVSRTAQVQGTPRSASMPGLLLATRRSEHPLSEGVDALTTNEPVALWHPRLAPVFSLSEDPQQGLLLAGQVGQGRLVVGGDPSVLINTMMRFPGNRQFARNLLVYLAGAQPGGRVYLVHSGFGVRGEWRGRARRRHPVREWVRDADQALAHAQRSLSDPWLLRALSVCFALLSLVWFAWRTWGSPPGEHQGPAAPSGPAASLFDKARLFSKPGANLLYPSLVARRLLEKRLLRATQSSPPFDAAVVRKRLQGRLSSSAMEDLTAVLAELEALARAVEAERTPRVTTPRFLSLWRRISAILSALRDEPR